jgi:lipopolysaccharide export system permease protein
MIIRRYVRSEVYKSVAAILLVLLLIFTLQRFVYYLRDAAAGELSSELVGILLAFQIPRILGLLLPLAVFLGVLLALGRMYADHEITVLRACGLGQDWLLRVLLVPMVVVALLSLSMTLYLTPWAQARQEEQLAREMAQRDVALLQAGRFQKTADGRGILFVEKKDGNGELENIFLAQLPKAESEPYVVVSSLAGKITRSEEGSRFLLLKKGQQWLLENNREADHGLGRKTDFDEYLSGVPDRTMNRRSRSVDAMSLEQLLSEASPKHIAELQWRVSMGLSVLILAAVAVPLARVRPREGRYARILPALIFYMLYLLLLIVSRNAVEREQIEPVFGLWWVHVVALLYLSFEMGWWSRWRRAS